MAKAAKPELIEQQNATGEAGEWGQAVSVVELSRADLIRRKVAELEAAQREIAMPDGDLPPSWEYTYLMARNSDDLLEKMNEAGTDGWEAINVDSFQGVAWMKRLVA